jgi:spore germination cell wall hydrolase CwlJ-like protein
MESTTKTFSYILGFIFVALLIKVVTIYKFNDFNSRADIPENVKTVAQMKKELDCMALNIYREAGHEPIEGRIAVAQVTMNRVDHPDFPNDVCGVVYQKSVVYSKIICQFSWYCDATHRARPINQNAYNESYEVAKKVMLENFRLPSLHDALYYHADYVNPRWKLERIEKIGAHIFYKQHGSDHKNLAGI